MEAPTATTTKTTEKSIKKTREEKLREQKIESEIVKSLSAINDPDQKYQTLLQRCVEAEKISRASQLLYKQNQKTLEGYILEKDNLLAENQRVLLTKSKLESLCRELQSQNKTIKEDSLKQIQNEEERRRETQEKFQFSLNEIQKLMTDNSEKNKKLEHDNREMSEKFKTIMVHYEEREKQMDRINKQMELVTQLNEAKMQKSLMENLAEKEGLMKQIKLLEETILIIRGRLSDSLNSEKHLRAQVDLYSSKYGEFTKSFEGYKTDMEKMSKKNFRNEKDMLQWRIKYEKTNAMLLDLLSEKQIRDEHIQKTAKQLFHLQKLCRTLSAEKKAFYAKLVECSIEIPEIKIEEEKEPVMPEVVEVDKKPENDKFDEMVKKSNELKSSLNELQSQLNDAIHVGGSTHSKKNRSKKSKRSSKIVGITDKVSCDLEVVEEFVLRDNVALENVELISESKDQVNGDVAVIEESKDNIVQDNVELVEKSKDQLVQANFELVGGSKDKVVQDDESCEPTVIPADADVV